MQSPEVKVKPRRIKYHSSTQKGVGAGYKDDSDNPLSQNFIPPEDRGDRGKARWWALHGKKFARRGTVEFDG